MWIVSISLVWHSQNDDLLYECLMSVSAWDVSSCCEVRNPQISFWGFFYFWLRWMRCFGMLFAYLSALSLCDKGRALSHRSSCWEWILVRRWTIEGLCFLSWLQTSPGCWQAWPGELRFDRCFLCWSCQRTSSLPVWWLATHTSTHKACWSLAGLQEQSWMMVIWFLLVYSYCDSSYISVGKFSTISIPLPCRCVKIRKSSSWIDSFSVVDQ